MNIEIDLLEQIKSSASRGLCSLTYEGAHSFLKSIRELCSARLAQIEKDIEARRDAPPPIIEPWMLSYGVARLVKNGEERIIIAMDGWATDHPRHEAQYLSDLLKSILRGDA